MTIHNLKMIAAIATLLAAAGCDEEPAPASVDNAAVTAQPAAAAPAPTVAANRYEPWGDPGCHILLKERSSGGHTAWVQSSADYGMALATHIDAIATLPHATELKLRLRADGDPGREVVARGQRGDDESDSANFLSIILDPPQRALIGGAKRVAVMRGETMLIELPVDTLGDLDAVARDCTSGGPGEFVDE